MKKKIIFRADGNSETGLGHLYRLFALVEMYKGTYEFIFVTRENSTLKVIPNNYPIQLIPNDIIIENEPNWLSKRFEPNEYIIIADGYQFVSSYQKSLKRLNYFLMYIDDLTTEYMYADIVVNHSINITKNSYKSKSYTNFAFGIDYAMLRTTFLEATKIDRKIESLDTVLICFGGADFYDLTTKTVKILLELEQIKKIHVIIGEAYKFKEIFNIENNNRKVKIYKNLGEHTIYNLMTKCNFAISPSSTISYELCSVGIPLLAGFYIDNQLNIYKGLLKEKVIFEVGNYRDLSNEFFKEKIKNAINKPLEFHQKIISRQKKMFNKEQKNNFLNLLK